MSAIYLVQSQYRRFDGKVVDYIAEAELHRCDFQHTVDDIAHGEYTTVTRVLRIDPETSVCADVTLDMQHQLRQRVANGDELSAEAREFIDANISSKAA